MEQLLSRELGKIVDEVVIHYKEDLEKDLEVLLDKNKASDTFIFLVRTSGTHLYEKAKLYAEEAGERTEFMYFKDSFKKAFEVTVTKRGRKHSYGTVKELTLNSLIKDVSNNGKSYDKVSVRVIKKDNSVLDTVFLTADSYYESLASNKLSYDDIERIYYLKYFN